MPDFHETTVRVRYAETDQMGVVYHSNFVIWFEVGRVELLRSLGFSYKEMEQQDDTRIVVVSVKCDYKKPARYDDLIRIRTRILETRSRILRFGYEVFNHVSGDLLATGETTHVTCDGLGRPKSLPEKYRALFPAAPESQATPRMNPVAINGNDLGFDQLYAVVFDSATISLAADARGRMEASRAVIERVVASDQTVYGVNTGFGELAEVRISRDQIRRLQVNLVRSHCCGVGAPLAESEVRAMLLLRANALAKGMSGVRPIVVETLCAMLNAGLHPVIPAQGSVGASGDLAPLAHLAAVVIGEGEAIYKGERLPGGEAMKRAGIAPLTLEAKEGLSLLNGTQGMLALLALALREAEILTDSVDVAAALSLDALQGSPAAFDERIAAVRPFPGAIQTARNLTRLNRGSTIRESHRSAERDPRVQDAYSLRCTPQVHGAVRDALAQIRATVTVELNAATDNPLVFATGAKGEGEVISGGNFHGQPLALAADQLAVALATLGGISERRIEHMTNPNVSLLPPFLTREPGLNSGFMLAQVTAAALASENKAFATPHSVDSIPTSGDQEDYVSMGMSAARRLRPMLDNLRHIVAIELLCACQGIDFLAPLRTGSEAQRAYDLVRTVSPRVDSDRALAPDIASVAHAIEAELIPKPSD